MITIVWTEYLVSIIDKAKEWIGIKTAICGLISCVYFPDSLDIMQLWKGVDFDHSNLGRKKKPKTARTKENGDYHSPCSDLEDEKKRENLFLPHNKPKRTTHG